MKPIADTYGRDLKDGDKILLIDWIQMLQEPLFTQGIVVEKENAFYLEDRELELLDIFKILEDGQDVRL